MACSTPKGHWSWCIKPEGVNPIVLPIIDHLPPALQATGKVIKKSVKFEPPELAANYLKTFLLVPKVIHIKHTGVKWLFFKWPRKTFENRLVLRTFQMSLEWALSTPKGHWLCLY